MCECWGSGREVEIFAELFTRKAMGLECEATAFPPHSDLQSAFQALSEDLSRTSEDCLTWKNLTSSMVD